MKWLLWILISLAVLPGVVMAAPQANIDATLLQYEPLPAEPGQFVTIYVEFENLGNEDAENVVIEGIDQFPFTVSSGKSEEIGRLGSRKTFVQEFRVKIASDAPVGDNEFSVRVSEKNSVLEESFDIEVQSNEAKLSVPNVELKPEHVKPGEVGALTLTLENDAGIPLRTISAKLTLQETLGSTVTDLPFIPVGSIAEKQVARLDPGKSTQVTFNIQPYPTATPGFYKIPLTLTYFDDSGNEETTEDVIGVVVAAAPELSVLQDETSIAAVGQTGTISLQYINKGINDLKFLDATLLDGEGYEVVGTRQQYIGDLDSDDFRTVTYRIKPSEKNPELLISATYKDENNKLYAFEESVQMTFIVAQNSSGGGAVVVIIIILLILAGIIWKYERRKKKSRKK